MYRYVLLALGLFITQFSFSQNAPSGGCGTIMPENYSHSLPIELRSIKASVPNAQRGAIKWIGVWYHIITKNDGTGGASLKDIFDSHCDLTTIFSVYDIGFYIGGIDTIKNTTLWNYQNSSLWGTTFSNNNVANYCNVYVNGNLPGLCGFATFPQGTSNRQGGVFLNKSCVGAGTMTYPHEMGHYLNLPHTFESSSGIELVDRSNCATAGDGFCDTPADFVDFRAPCPYSGDSTDPNGDLYRTVIDESLFMSYFSDNCLNKFSNEEADEMNSTLTGRRSYLLTPTVPDSSPLDSAVIVYPVNGNNNINSSSTRFVWNKVPNAVYYNFRLQSATSTLVTVDTIIKDTSIAVNNLIVNRNYRYRVKAYSFGNTCAENANFQFVKTSLVKATLSVTAPECNGSNNGVITAAASNGTAPYSYFWSNGATSQVVNNLAPGIYSVTITDNAGAAVIAQTTISEPAPLTVSINPVGNNLNAYAAGGIGPYSYSWSNGINSQFNNNVAYDTYTVTVVDSKGCSAIQTLVFSSVGVEMDNNVTVNIYPNPSKTGTTLTLDITSAISEEGTFSVYNLQGSLVYQSSLDLVPGKQLIPVNIGDISAGMYIGELKTKSLQTVKRVTVLQ